MRKRSILFLTLLAIGAFFARSPEAVHVVQGFWKNSGGHSGAGRQDIARNSPQAGGGLLRRRQTLSPPMLWNLRTRTREFQRKTPVPGIGGDASVAEDKQSDREEELAREVAAVPEGELKQVLESSLHDDGTNSAQFRELLVRHWAETDPKAAALWAGSLESSPTASPAVRQAATAWADKDLAAALEWVETMPEGTSREAAIVAIGYEAARTNSFETFDLVASLPPSSERDALLVHFVRQWSATDRKRSCRLGQSRPQHRVARATGECSRHHCGHARPSRRCLAGRRKSESRPRSGPGRYRRGSALGTN